MKTVLLNFGNLEDVLPPRSIELYGFVNLYKRIKPLSITENSIWYIIDGTLWTSELSASHTIELDEYINAETKTDGTFSRVVQFTNEVPDYNATLNEHFISFTTHEDNRNLLQVTSTRYDENQFSFRMKVMIFYCIYLKRMSNVFLKRLLICMSCQKRIWVYLHKMRFGIYKQY